MSKGVLASFARGFLNKMGVKEPKEKKDTVCSDCEGSGQHPDDEMVSCPKCEGTGK